MPLKRTTKTLKTEKSIWREELPLIRPIYRLYWSNSSPVGLDFGRLVDRGREIETEKINV
jgi:hypothetical protein